MSHSFPVAKIDEHAWYWLCV